MQFDINGKAWPLFLLAFKAGRREQENAIYFSEFDVVWAYELQKEPLDGEVDEEAFFTRNGRWNDGPTTWIDPEAALRQQESKRLNKKPPND